MDGVWGTFGLNSVTKRVNGVAVQGSSVALPLGHSGLFHAGTGWCGRLKRLGLGGSKGGQGTTGTCAIRAEVVHLSEPSIDPEI